MGLPDWLAEKIAATPEYKAKFSMGSIENKPLVDLDVISSTEESDLPF
jgi:hypothetical protein